MSFEKGSILIYSLLMMSVMLAIGIGMSSVFLKNLRGIRQARNSTTALYAADTGTELCLYEARSGVVVDRNDVLLQQGSTFTIASLSFGSPPVDVTLDCTVLGPESFVFRSTGVFRDSSRALLIEQ